MIAELNQILNLTREMLAKAQAGEWEDLISLESRRGAMIVQHFNLSPSANIDAGDAACLHQLRELNGRILEIGKTQRQQLMQILADGNRQRHAAGLYRQTRKS